MSNNKLKIICFSKNRPLQLYSLIESFNYYCKDKELADIDILINSDDIFLDSYKFVSSKFVNLNFIYEKNFKEDFCSILEKTNNYFVCFLVDDIIFTDYFNIKDILNLMKSKNEIFSFSLRLGKNINFSYTLNKSISIPDLINLSEDLFYFNIKDCQSYWGYPFSLDGNIYRLHEFVYFYNFIKDSIFSPNTLESKLSILKNNITSINMSCFEKSKLINIPDNIVQIDFKNRSLNNDVFRFLNKFNNNKKIDFLKFKNIENKSCHVELNYSFINI